MTQAMAASMKSLNTITLAAPFRDVRVLAAPTRAETEQRVRAAESAAYERGRHDGEKSLREQLVQQRAEMLELHQGVLDALRNAVPQLIHETESALTELAIEAAQKLIAGLPIEPAAIEAVVREALDQIENRTEIAVHLNAEDLALLRKHNSPLLLEQPESITFVGIQEISRGGCVIHTRFGMIDGRRETKIEQLRKSIA